MPSIVIYCPLSKAGEPFLALEVQRRCAALTAAKRLVCSRVWAGVCEFVCFGTTLPVTSVERID